MNAKRVDYLETDEPTLMALVKTGDMQAFGELDRRHHKIMFPSLPTWMRQSPPRSLV